ncbi:MAG: DUF2469 domain-containing protein [Actinomycetota bacterium]|jgi:hypothetical protein|nr:DUF2469 domain-containing protein [Actinomycetota bacterium]
MSVEDLEKYEAEMELQLYKEYRDVLPMFKFVVETERRFYLANEVQVETKSSGAKVWFEVELNDAWVWDMHRPARFVSHVRVVTFRDLNVEELAQLAERDLLPNPPGIAGE